MSMAIYNQVEVRKAIIELLAMEGYEITDENIKIWSTDFMQMGNVVLGCEYVLREGLSPVLVYTNKVDYIEHFEKKYGVKVFDVGMLKKLAMKHSRLDIYDLI